MFDKGRTTTNTDKGVTPNHQDQRSLKVKEDL